MDRGRQLAQSHEILRLGALHELGGHDIHPKRTSQWASENLFCHPSITWYHQLVGWLILTKATKHLLMSMHRQGKYIRHVEGQRLGLSLSGRALVRDSA